MKYFLMMLLICSISMPASAQDESELIKHGRKVFIESKDEGAALHAEHFLDYKGYWDIVEDKKDADFIIRLKTKSSGIFTKAGYAVFIDAKTGKEFYRTEKIGTFWRMTFNYKRGLVKKLVNKEIKPYYKEVNSEKDTHENQ